VKYRELCPLCLLLALLHVLVAEEGQGASDQDDGVEADAHVGLAGAAGAGLRGGGGLLGFGGRVVGLIEGVSFSPKEKSVALQGRGKRENVHRA